MKLVLTGSLVDIIKTCGHPPLGICYISSYLRKYGGFNDIVIIEREDDQIAAIRREKPDILGMSLHTIEVNEGIKLAEQVKSEFDIPILVGGPHFTFVPHTLPNSIDVAILHEGEQTTLELIQIFEKHGLKKDALKNLRGIAYHDNGRIKVTKRRPLIKNLDDIPFPARDLLKMKEFYLKPRRVFRGYLRRGTHMITSRGCPYRCVYCGSAKFWNTIRFHSAEYVVSEIEELINKYKVEAITFYDDLFIANKKRVEEILRLMKEHGLIGKVIFECQGRANLMNEKICKLLKEMGVVSIAFGFESGSEKILKYLKKGTVTVEQNKYSVNLCKKYGFLVEGTFMIGAPFETKEDMMKTLRFIKEQPLDAANIYVTTPLVGTELWDYAKAEGIVSENMDFSKTNIHANPTLEDNIYLNKMVSREEFGKIVEEFGKICSEINYSHINFRPRDLLSLDLIKRILAEPNQIWLYLRNILKRRLKIGIGK